MTTDQPTPAATRADVHGPTATTSRAPSSTATLVSTVDVGTEIGDDVSGLAVVQPTSDPTAPRAEPSSDPGLLGELLIARGLLTRVDLERALAMQARSQSQLGAVLVAAGLVRPQQLFEVLAGAWGSSLAASGGASLEQFAPEWYDRLDGETMLAEGWVPVGRDIDGIVHVMSSRRPTSLLYGRVEAEVGETVRISTGSDWQVSRAVQTVKRASLLAEATLGLWRRSAAASARTVLDRRQQIVFASTLVAVVGVIVAFPRQSLSALSLVVSLAFLVGIVFKFVICMLGARREHREVVTQAEVDALRDADLPVYTVLVPCYREEKIVAQLVDNLGALDYPAEKLEILLLLEADDEATLNAAKAGNPPHTVTIVVTPDGQPKTKPKACNVGLALARGEYLVIYDAEDKPDPDQLKRAVVAFRKARRGTVCVQAALNYFNADENALTRLFTLEYSFWFDYMLPGLDAAKLPIPLGGTSNHFVTARLRELGGWDPFNVTEDADLGIRASARGFRVGVIDSTTFEEANTAYGNWLRQRSRWIKGYMQTTLVHLRHPARLVREAGVVPALSFCLLIGGTAASFLAVIPLYLLLAVTLVLPPSALSPYFPGWVLWFSLVNLLLGNGLMIWVSMMGAFRRRRYWLVTWALLNPLYWIMHSLAAYKGLWQLITKPHYWEKTAHGLSTVDADAAMAAETDASRGLIPSGR